jgi:transposase
MEVEKFSIAEETISAIYREGIGAVKKLVLQLCEQINLLNERVKKLEDQLAKDSHNSHKPPSSDGFKSGIKSVRVESEKGVGGQKGHEGRTLSFAEQVDEVVMHEMGKECPGCGESLEEVRVSRYERRQVWDIPEVKMKVVEHRVPMKECPSCGERIQGEFPPEVNASVQYGERIRALGVYLNQYQLLPYERTSQLLEDVFDFSSTVNRTFQPNSLTKTTNRL